MSAMPIEWEEQTERRLGIVENKVDKIMDPETGIYPKLSGIESRLKTYVITILVTVLGSSALTSYFVSRGH